jgi:outer membrane protein TolC
MITRMSALYAITRLSRRHTVIAHSSAILFLLLGMQLISPCCVAQQSPAASPSTTSDADAPLKLTLKQAVQLGLKQNPQRVISQILVSESRRNMQISRSALLPQAAITGRAGLSQYNLQSVEAGPRGAAGPFQFIEVGPSFSQTVLSLPQIRGYQIGQEGIRGARADEQTERETVVSAVVTQYLLVLRAIANRDAVRSRVALAQRLFDQADELQRTGIGLNIDSVRANVELQNEKQNLIDAETQTRTTRYALAELLDLPREQELDATDTLDFYDLPSLERDVLIDQALKQRPEVRSLNSERRVAKLTTDANREQRLPQLGFNGFWYYQGQHFNDGIPAYSYELSLDFPIFTGGRIRAQEARAKLEEYRIEQNRRALEARIVKEVKTAFDELTAARAAVDVANLGFKLAQDEVAQAQRRFAAGVTTNVEVITAQDALARASDSQIDALFRFNLSRADLARATGEIESTYAK